MKSIKHILLFITLFTIIIGVGQSVNAAGTDDFVITIQTDNAGFSGDTEFYFPSSDATAYDIDWGDGDIDLGVTGVQLHDYGVAGTYTIRATGVTSVVFNFDPLKLISVDQWGTSTWTTMGSMFEGASNLDVVATDAPDLSAAIDLSWMFRNATSMNGNIDHWDVSNITTTVRMFQGATSFDQPLNSWNMTGVLDISYMFDGATSFDQPLNSWDTSDVTNTFATFQDATSFNQSLSNWDMSQVDFINNMFNGASSFDQDISAWELTSPSLGTMDAMFTGATAFSDENYDLLLNGWSEHTLRSGRDFAAPPANYCEGEAGRDILTDTYSWTITGDTLYCVPRLDITGGTFGIGEGFSDTFTITPHAVPSEATTITIEGNEDLDFGSGAGQDHDIVFTTKDPITVTVEAVDDTLIEDDEVKTVSIGISAGAAEYLAETASATITITDNDERRKSAKRRSYGSSNNNLGQAVSSAIQDQLEILQQERRSLLIRLLELLKSRLGQANGLNR